MVNKYYDIKNWIFNNPKKFYTYAMIIILISFLFTILQYIFFPPEFKVKSLVPSLYAKSDQYKTVSDKKVAEMGKIVKELQVLQQKNNTQGLNSNDSIRLQYLYNEYQNIKNGLKKN